MSLMVEMIAKIKNDSIKNEELIICLQARNYTVVALSMFKAMERNYCNQDIIERLTELSKLLKDNKLIGPWQLGHIALATLSLLGNDDAKIKFRELFECLSDTDIFLVENFIKSEAYKDI